MNFLFLAILFYTMLCSIAQHESPSNSLTSQCQSLLDQLYANFGEDENAHLFKIKRTIICQIPPPLQKLRISQLLNFSSSLLHCNQLPFNTSYNARAKIGRSIRLACFDPFQNGLTILFAHFGHSSSPSILFLTRQHHPLWTLNDLPKAEIKFKRFPTLDLRLPADFFYPFGGC